MLALHLTIIQTEVDFNRGSHRSHEKIQRLSKTANVNFQGPNVNISS